MSHKKEKDLRSRLEEHPENWDDMSEKEKDRWAFKQTQLAMHFFHKDLTEGIKTEGKKRIRRGKHISGVLTIILAVMIFLASRGVVHIAVPVLLSLPTIYLFSILYLRKKRIRLFRLFHEMISINKEHEYLQRYHALQKKEDKIHKENKKE